MRKICNFPQYAERSKVGRVATTYAWCRRRRHAAETTGLRTIFEEYSAYCRFDEASLQLKHEGEVVAYRVKLNDKAHQAAQAPWQAFAAENQSNN